MWRQWYENGQSLEICWGRECSIGIKYGITGNEDDLGDRILNISLLFAQAFIPLGVVNKTYHPMEGPRWGVEVSREFGMQFYWGDHWKSWDLPLTLYTIRYQYLGQSGEDWFDVREESNGVFPPMTAVHPYTYRLESGEIQNRWATISRRRHILGRKWVPKWLYAREAQSIDIEFSDEVGERSGSWKGGTIGCSYKLREGETPEECLRRMEEERKF